jgi:hypothetical protein
MRPFGGVRLTEYALFTDDLSTDEKIMAGLILDPRARNDSIARLVRKGPFNREKTTKLRKTLHDRNLIRWKTGGRYRNSKRVNYVDPRLEPADGAVYSVIVPGQLLDRILAACPRSGAAATLITAAYIREQVRLGLIRRSDNELAMALGLSDDTVCKNRARLMAADILVKVGEHEGESIYEIPDALVKPEPDRFLPEYRYDLLSPLPDGTWRQEMLASRGDSPGDPTHTPAADMPF